MASFKITRLALILALISSSVMALPMNPNAGLVNRLQWDGDGSSNCWDSLVELQACSGEVIMFFLNGENRLGHGCCQAIRTIENQCWPSMLTTLGFTAEEGNILEGYCDEEANSIAPPPPPPSIAN